MQTVTVRRAHGNESVENFHKIRNGILADRTTTNVCQKCNSGWLSTIVERPAGEIIPRLSNGSLNILNRDQLERLAAWAAKVTITNEYTLGGRITITQQDRTVFMKTGKAPAGWMIFIGKYKGAELHLNPNVYFASLSYTKRVGGDFDRTRPISPIIPKEVQSQAQSTTFAVNNILFHVVTNSSPVTINYPVNLDIAAGMHLIEPDGNNELDWESLAAISEEMAKNITQRLYKALMAMGISLPTHPSTASARVNPPTAPLIRQNDALASLVDSYRKKL